MDKWKPMPLPPRWALEAWDKLGGCWLNSEGARFELAFIKQYIVSQRITDPGEARPWIDGGPALDFWARCLATVEPDSGREWGGNWGYFGPSHARLFMVDPNYVCLDDGTGGVWCRRHAPKSKPAPVKGPAQTRLEALTGWPAMDHVRGGWIGPSVVKRWAGWSCKTNRVSIFPSGGHVTDMDWHSRPVTGDITEAACAELLRRHDDGVDPLPCQRAEVPEGWDVVARGAPSVASSDLCVPGSWPERYLLADGTISNKVDKGQWYQGIRPKKAPSLRTEPPGIYRVAFRGEVAKFAKWSGEQLTMLGSGSTRSCADVVAWDRVSDVDRKPAPDDDAELAKAKAPALGVWLGRPPTEAEREAHALEHGAAMWRGGRPEGWWAFITKGGDAYTVSYVGAGILNFDEDAAPAENEDHAKELIEAKRRENTKAAETPVDPRIGRWVALGGALKGLVVGVCDGDLYPLSVITPDGGHDGFRGFVRIIPPPDPIPAPCRPVWDAFEALRAAQP